MARVIGFLVIVAAATGGALVLVTERAAATHSGYRVAQLERERRQLIEEARLLRAQVARLKNPARIQERAKSLRVPAMPPDEGLKQRLKDRQAAGATPAEARGGASRQGGTP